MIYREEYEGGRDFYHAVAVIKKGSLTNVRNLKVPNISFFVKRSEMYMTIDQTLNPSKEVQVT